MTKELKVYTPEVRIEFTEEQLNPARFLNLKKATPLLNKNLDPIHRTTLGIIVEIVSGSKFKALHGKQGRLTGGNLTFGAVQHNGKEFMLPWKNLLTV